MADLVKVTVYLTPDAYAALRRAAEFEEISRTDVINRALLIYEPIATARSGAIVQFTDPLHEWRTITVRDSGQAVP